MDGPRFVCPSSADGHVGYFRLRAIAGSVATDVRVCAFGWASGAAVNVTKRRSRVSRGQAGGAGHAVA